MEELKIYEFQAKHILEALRLASRTLDCKTKETCLDRDVMQAIGMIENVIAEKIDEQVKRD